MTNYQYLAKQILKSELALRNISHNQLADMFYQKGEKETKSSIDNKISRGTFSADFFLKTLIIIGTESIDLRKCINVK